MDSRSAVYCKMGMYEKALGDAKHMIRAAAKDERVSLFLFVWMMSVSATITFTHPEEPLLNLY